jgi:hypothetical protein
MVQTAQDSRFENHKTLIPENEGRAAARLLQQAGKLAKQSPFRFAPINSQPSDAPSFSRTNSPCGGGGKNHFMDAILTN